jgi:phosphatidate cytidylyltransferase
MVRLISGVALAAAALAAILFLPPTGLLLAASGVAFLAALEYQRVVRGWVGLPAAAALACFIVGRLQFGDATFLVLVIAIGFGVSAAVLFRDQPLDGAASNAFGVIYIAVPLGALVLIHRLGGAETVLLLLFTVVVSDSAQYYTGRLFGRHALAPAISPKKTIEGAVGGLVIGPLFLIVAGRFVLPFVRLPLLAGLGVAVVALGIAGDLFESRLKRTAGVKDSSTLIPGHGGILDRIDALLFAAPAFYLFLTEVM